MVKKNQKELFEDISCAFAANKPLSIEENWEYDHSRFEIRKYSILLAQSTMDEEIVTGWFLRRSETEEFYYETPPSIFNSLGLVNCIKSEYISSGISSIASINSLFEKDTLYSF